MKWKKCEKVCSHVLILRKGEILYSGTVEGMTSKESFFELQSDDHEILRNILSKHPAVEKTVSEEGKIIAYLKSDLAASELNRFVFENGVTLSHLVKRKNSLEEQFLELTAENN